MIAVSLLTWWMDFPVGGGHVYKSSNRLLDLKPKSVTNLITSREGWSDAAALK